MIRKNAFLMMNILIILYIYVCVRVYFGAYIRTLQSG